MKSFRDWAKEYDRLDTLHNLEKLNKTPIKDLLGATSMDLFNFVKDNLEKPDLWSEFFCDLQNNFLAHTKSLLGTAYADGILTKEKDLPIVYIKGMNDKCFVYYYSLVDPKDINLYDHALIDNTLESKIQFLKIWYIDRYLPSQVPQPIHDFIGNGLSMINSERVVEKKEDVIEKEKGRKDDKDKLRFDLISPFALEEIAKVLSFGANKYGDRNWEKGLSYDRLLGAMYRHINAFQQGNIIDSDNGCHHMASVAFCAMAILHFHKTGNFSKEDGVKYEPANNN